MHGFLQKVQLTGPGPLVQQQFQLPWTHLISSGRPLKLSYKAVSHWALSSFITVVHILTWTFFPGGVSSLCSLINTKVKWLQLIGCTCMVQQQLGFCCLKDFPGPDHSSGLGNYQESWLIMTVHLLSNSCDVWLEDILSETYACISFAQWFGVWNTSNSQGKLNQGWPQLVFPWYSSCMEGTGHQELL